MMADDGLNVVRRKSIRKASQSSYILNKNAQNELRKKLRKVSEILKKPEQERSIQDRLLVKKNPELVKASEKNARRLQANKERILETEDQPNLLGEKCERLADLIRISKSVVVYTGAGISTAASIPDYRGPNGVWTLMKKGQELSPQDLSDAEPTFTHMSLTKLFRVGKVKHIVSQNCDGLHIRSGFPRHAISEVHGNMYIECCYKCAPHKEYIRLFDVTEHTGIHRHATGRRCRSCGGSLQDTIVHFGEKGKLKSPYRWKEAVRAAKRADLILCLGSSLKVLRKYACLWCMDKKPQYRPKLVIVNLQWTPKDDIAVLKINGRCDSVMMKVMKLLGHEVSEYSRAQDPIFRLCTTLRKFEGKTTTKKILVPPLLLQEVKNTKSRKKVSKSSRRNSSSRLIKSVDKHVDVRLYNHIISKSFLSLEPLQPSPASNNSFSNDSQQIQAEENTNIEGDISSECPKYHDPFFAELLAVEKSDETPDCADTLISDLDLAETVNDSQSHILQEADDDKYMELPDSFVLNTFKAERLLNHNLPNGKVGKKVKRKAELASSHIKRRKSGNNSLRSHLKQAGAMEYTNKNIPQLVVINLEKVETTKTVDLQHEQFKARNDNMLNSDVVMYLSRGDLRDPNYEMTELLRENSRHDFPAASNQMNSFISQTLESSKVSPLNILHQDMPTAPTLLVQNTLMSEEAQVRAEREQKNSIDMIENEQNIIDLAHIFPLVSLSNENCRSLLSATSYLHTLDQCTEQSSCICSLVLDEQFVHVQETSTTSENSLSNKRAYSGSIMNGFNHPHNGVVIQQHIRSNITNQEKITTTLSDGSYATVSTRSPVDHYSVAYPGTDHAKQHQKMGMFRNQSENVSLPTLHLVLGNIKSICLDHCYTQSELSSCARKMGHIDSSHVRHNKHHKSCTHSQNAKNGCPRYTSKRFCCQDINHVSCSVSSLDGSKKVCCENNLMSCVSETKSACRTQTDEMELSEPAACTRNISREEHQCQVKIHDKPNSYNSTFCDSKTESSLGVHNDVPSCVLNMDDMETVYSVTGASQLSSAQINHQDYLPCAEFTHIMEISKLTAPLDYKDFLFTSDTKGFSSAPPDSYISGLGGNSDSTEFNESCCVNCVSFEQDTSVVFPDTNGLENSVSDKRILDIGIRKPNSPSSEDKEKNHDTIKIQDKSECLEDGKQNISCEPSRQACNGVCRSHLRDTSMPPHGNMEVKATNTKSCPPISHKSDVKKINKHSVDSKEEERENMCRKFSKHKKLSAGVPGWFGKGLALKRKRKL